MDSIEIETDVPVPGTKPHHRTKYPFKSMAIGNSIFVSSQDDPGGRRLRLAAYSCAYMHKEFRYQFAESAKKGVPGHRIWRVSNGPTEKGHLPNRPLVRDVVGRSPAAADVDDTGQAEYEKERDAEEKERESEDAEYERQKAADLAELMAEKEASK